MDVQCHDCGARRASTKIGVDYVCAACAAARSLDPNSLVGQTVSVPVSGDPRINRVRIGNNTFYDFGGARFLTRQAAEEAAWLNDQRQAVACPHYTLLGVSFITPNHAITGHYEWDYQVQAWRCTPQMWTDLRAMDNTAVKRQIDVLREAQRRGDTVVKARVENSPRRPTPAPRPRKGDLHDLRERTQALVVQIATMSDKGAIPDGQIAELSKSYAALQAEFDDALGEVEQIKENLSIMRAIMFEHSDPRNAREAIA